MKLFKFFVSLLSAVLTAYSPVSWAAMDSAQKSQFNRRIKEQFVGNNKSFNELYQEKGHFFDARSRQLLEAWLSANGNGLVKTPEAQVIKDSQGNQSIKMLITEQGKTLALSLSEKDQKHVDINGVKFAITDLPDVMSVLQRLSEKDSSLKPLLVSMRTASLPPAKKSNMIAYSLFDKITPIQRVEYLMRLRETLESAHQVVVEAGAQTASRDQVTPEYRSYSVFNPLFASLLAYASTKTGDQCLVAGYISVYEKNGSRLACNPFPQNPGDKVPPPSFDRQCNPTEGDVACNPLLYGAQADGKPFCVSSANAREFTRTATLQCNNKSPLSKDPDSTGRRADYERILKSYYNLKNGKDAKNLGDCFNKSHKVDAGCAKFFNPQLDEFREFINQAKALCGSLESGKSGTSDQPATCEKLKERALELQTFLEEVTENIQRQPVASVDVEEEACKKLPGATWNAKTHECVCSDGKLAQDSPYNGFKTFICPVALAPKPLPVIEKEKEKDSCKKEHGEESHSFTCSPWPWLIGGGILLALMWPRDHDNSPQNPGPQPAPPIAPVIGPRPPVKPPPVEVFVPPAKPPVTPPPAREGGAGTGPGTNGGVRSTEGAK